MTDEPGSDMQMTKHQYGKMELRFAKEREEMMIEEIKTANATPEDDSAVD